MTTETPACPECGCQDTELVITGLSPTGRGLQITTKPTAEKLVELLVLMATAPDDEHIVALWDVTRILATYMEESEVADAIGLYSDELARKFPEADDE